MRRGKVACSSTSSDKEGSSGTNALRRRFLAAGVEDALKVDLELSGVSHALQQVPTYDHWEGRRCSR